MRSPLNAIAGWTRLMRESMPGVETANALDVIERNVERLARLADSLVDSSQPNDAPPYAAPATPAHPVQRDHLRVLVVDDDADTRETSARILRERGHDVALASSAIEAIHLYFDSEFDVLISDIGMAGVDGYELLRLLRSERKGCTIPAIAVTGYAGARARKRAFAAGFQAHLQKPVLGEQLVDAVAFVTGLDAH
jgi:CheY-like chemotaxis protein